MIGTDIYLHNFVVISLIALLIGIVLRFFKQPSVIAYILTGILIGSDALGLVKDYALITQLGNIGVVFLLFFVGMEINLIELIKNWRIAVLGTALQIVFSVFFVWLIGLWIGWPYQLSILIGFVISLSSTAVLLKLLDSKGIMNTRIGKDVLSILLMQDLAVVPMLFIVSMMSSTSTIASIGTQIVGLLLIILFFAWILKEKTISLPFKDKIEEDHELQLLSVFVICFGFSLLTGLFQLSAAIGAFLAGIFVSSTKTTQWAHQSLASFKVIFMAFFFISVGLLIDLDFISRNILIVMGFVFLVFLTNTFLNAFVFKWLGESWKYSLYVGAILAQIGEFSFLLAAVGFQNGLLSTYANQLIISVIAISLLLSPFWITAFSRHINEVVARIRDVEKSSVKLHKMIAEKKKESVLFKGMRRI